MATRRRDIVNGARQAGTGYRRSWAEAVAVNGLLDLIGVVVVASERRVDLGQVEGGALDDHLPGPLAFLEKRDDILHADTRVVGVGSPPHTSGVRVMWG